MDNSLPVIYLARHGETAWSLTGQHTGRTDLPLTERGEHNARRLRERLAGLRFAKVFTSPSQRAVRTCELAGFGATAEVDANLVEWNYGDYEGLRTVQIHAKHPDWQLFRDGCPNGESPEQIGARADRTVSRLREIEGDVLIFSSGHFLRVLPPLAGPRARRRQILHVNDRQPERARLRKQFIPASDPVLGRHPACGRLK